MGLFSPKLPDVYQDAMKIAKAQLAALQNRFAWSGRYGPDLKTSEAGLLDFINNMGGMYPEANDVLAQGRADASMLNPFTDLAYQNTLGSLDSVVGDMTAAANARIAARNQGANVGVSNAQQETSNSIANMASGMGLAENGSSTAFADGLGDAFLQGNQNAASLASNANLQNAGEFEGLSQKTFDTYSKVPDLANSFFDQMGVDRMRPFNRGSLWADKRKNDLHSVGVQFNA
jgi:hypothetical protein